MRRLLIITDAPALLPDLTGRYDVTWCRPGEAAAALLQQNVDGLILDLFLPDTDGLSLLQSLQHRLPPVVLALTAFYSPYVLQAAEELGVGYVLRYPFAPNAFFDRLEDMFRKFEAPVPDTAAASARYHLKRLGISAGKGYRRMLSIFPGFDPDAGHNLFSDFYLDLARAESVSPYAIDNAIHRTIAQAYEARNDAIWREYFPDTSRYPTNKEFLTAVAERMKQKAPSR